MYNYSEMILQSTSTITRKWSYSPHLQLLRNDLRVHIYNCSEM